MQVFPTGWSPSQGLEHSQGLTKVFRLLPKTLKLAQTLSQNLPPPADWALSPAHPSLRTQPRRTSLSCHSNKCIDLAILVFSVSLEPQQVLSWNSLGFPCGNTPATFRVTPASDQEKAPSGGVSKLSSPCAHT
jgi:hypothetical protein